MIAAGHGASKFTRSKGRELSCLVGIIQKSYRLSFFFPPETFQLENVYYLLWMVLQSENSKKLDSSSTDTKINWKTLP